MKRFCEHCGTALEDGAMFCEQCGTAAVQAEPTVPVPQPPAAPVVQPPTVAAVAYYPVEQKRSSVLPWVIVIVLLSAIIVVGAILLIPRLIDTDDSDEAVTTVTTTAEATPLTTGTEDPASKATVLIVPTTPDGETLPIHITTETTVAPLETSR